MERMTARLALIVVLALCVTSTAGAAAGQAPVPRLVKFAGTVAGGPGPADLTFAFYAEQASEAPLWAETQRVDLDASGHYAVHLGTSRPDGLPAELFATGDARWLGVRVDGQPEQPRVLLVSVPYALKAADADTIGGKPLSAFVLAGEKTGVGADGLTYVSPRVLAASLASTGAPGGAGSPNYVGLFTDATTLGNSVIYQTPAGSVGLNTTTPAAGFHAVATASPATFFDVYSDALGALPVVYRAARGTPAAPSAVQTGDILGGLAVRGYGATGFSAGRGQVMFRAAETWTDAAQGTFLQFTTTPVGTGAWAERMRITPEGRVGIGTATPSQALSVAGIIESTTGGVKFPDGSTQLAANPSSGVINPLQLALGRWYRLNLSVETTCMHPTSIAFDGTTMWIAGVRKVTPTSQTGGSVEGVAADGLVWGLCAGDKSPSPSPLPPESAFAVADGTGVWFAFDTDLMLDRRCSVMTGCVSTASVRLPNPATALAYDGVRLWAATSGRLLSFVDQLVDTGKGPELPSPTQYLSASLSAASALLFDGTNLWVAGSALARIDPTAPGTVTPTVFGVVAHPTALTFDGTYIWAATAGGDVVKLLASDGTEVQRVSVGGAPKAILFDGVRIWVANSPLNQVTVLSAASGATLRTFPAGVTPTALAFDGMNVWIAGKGDGSNWGTLMKR
jgi:hypothetical protein